MALSSMFNALLQCIACILNDVIRNFFSQLINDHTLDIDGRNDFINKVSKEIVYDIIQNASDESQEELDIEESAIKRLHRKLIKWRR